MLYSAKSPRPDGRLVLCGMFVCLLLAGAPAWAADRLALTVDDFLSSGARAKARVGVNVVALRTGRVIYRRAAADGFIAASNEKLVTAAAALDALGEDYFFETALYAAGPVTDGVLQGNLVLRGGGDPSLGGRYEDEDATAIFKRWAGVLKAKGIRQVSGDVVADDTFFDRVYYHPDWPRSQAWKWYLPPTSALSVNDNCVTVTVQPGDAPGAPARVSFVPSCAPVELSNQCKTSATSHAVGFAREPDSNVIVVNGTVKQGSGGYSEMTTVPEPPLYAACVLRQALLDAGISVSGGPRLIGPGESAGGPGGEPLCVRRTALVSVLRTMLQHSHNHYAEEVLKTVGAVTAGVGTWQTGTARAALMLRQMGFSDSEFNLADGSGLSRKNRLSPALLATVLTRMSASEHGATFESLLAVPGEEGTLRNRLEGAAYADKVRAKTGYLDGVGALSGYATTRGGLEVAFSILVNDEKNPVGSYSMRETVDTICRAIVDYAE